MAFQPHLELFSLFIMININEMTFSQLAVDFLNTFDQIRGEKDPYEFKRELLKATQSEVLGISNMLSG